jgi:hypothetical protein
VLCDHRGIIKYKGIKERHKGTGALCSSASLIAHNKSIKGQVNYRHFASLHLTIFERPVERHKGTGAL